MVSPTTVLHNVRSPRSGWFDAPPSPRPRPQRDALLDNAKFLLIALVVVGHTIEPDEQIRVSDVVYHWIYLFHMPAFVLISGYLSKSFDGSARRVDKLLTTVAAPYAVFWVLYTIQSIVAGRELADGPLAPVWITWFLAALFFWRLSVPLWRRIRWPIPVSIGISLATVFLETTDAFDLSRIVGMLPFFVVGLFLEQRHIAMLKRRWVQACSVLTMLAAGVFSYLILAGLDREWLYYRETLADRDFPYLPYGIPATVFVMALNFAMCAAVLSLTPSRRTFFTAFGSVTMYVFLLHGLVLRTIEEFGWWDFTDTLGDVGSFTVNVSLGLALTFLLITPWVRKATRWAVEPGADRLLRRDTAAPPG